MVETSPARGAIGALTTSPGGRLPGGCGMPWELRGSLDIGRALEDSIAGEQAATLTSNEAAEKMNSPRMGCFLTG